jgi:hypothetical protein
MSARDLLLVAMTAGSIGLLLAGAFYSWALILGLIFLATGSFYLGFVYKAGGGGAVAELFNVFLQVRSQTAFVMSIGLVAFVVFAMDQGRRDLATLSEYIEIYEPSSSVEPVWKVDDDLIGTVILRTEDPASSVLYFYQRMAMRDGWEISSYSPPTFASMQKANAKLTLMARDSDSEDTVIIITLAKIED